MANEQHTFHLTLRQAVGEDCIAFLDGKRVFDLIAPRVKADEVVILDFSGVDVVASPFLNAAVGQLFSLFSQRSEFEKHLHWVNTTPDIEETLEHVISNSMRYYNDPKRRNIVSELRPEDE